MITARHPKTKEDKEVIMLSNFDDRKYLLLDLNILNIFKKL